MELDERIHKLKDGCFHENGTKEGSYMWAPGHTAPCDVCADCGAYPIEIPDYLDDPAAVLEALINVLENAPNGLDFGWRSGWCFIDCKGETSFPETCYSIAIWTAWCEWRENING